MRYFFMIAAMLVATIAWADPGSNHGLMKNPVAGSPALERACSVSSYRWSCYFVITGAVQENSTVFTVTTKEAFAYLYPDTDGDGYSSVATFTFHRILPDGTLENQSITPAHSTNPLSAADGANPFTLTGGNWWIEADGDSYGATLEIRGAQ